MSVDVPRTPPPDEAVPRDVRAFDTPLALLGAGGPGKAGLLDLAFAPVAGVTRVVRHVQRAPLYAFHPFHIDPHWPAMAFLFLMQAGEGWVQGDRYRVDVDCAAGSAVHLTTPAATKVFRMDDNYAAQDMRLRAGPGAFVEYLPDPIVPFRGARFCQRTRVVVDPDACVIWGETLLPGRVARGERHAYTMLHMDWEAHAPDGALLCADRWHWEPARMPPSSPGLLGTYDVVATLYVLARRAEALGLAKRLQELCAGRPKVLAGASELPHGAGVVVRILAHASDGAAAAMRVAWDEARRALAGVEAPSLRKN